MSYGCRVQSSLTGCVGDYDTDALARRFTTRRQFLTLRFANLSGTASILDLQVTRDNRRARLCHVARKARSAPRLPTPTDCVTPDSFPSYSKRCWKGRLPFDSTFLRLSWRWSQWARFSSQVCGTNAHMNYHSDLCAAVYHAMSTANVNDITAVKQRPIEARRPMSSTFATTTMLNRRNSTPPTGGLSSAFERLCLC